MPELPVIFIATANEQEGRRYLRDLPEESRQVREVLHEAEDRGLCKLEVRSNATLKEVIQVFNEYRDRVAVFHYGGHADSGHLLLESSKGDSQEAGAVGLAVFLRERRGLQLAFLNGCSTRAQASLLIDAGVGAVIATSRAIEDRVAREFAVAFYTELAAGAPLGSAYRSSMGQVRTGHGEATTVYYQGRELGGPAAVAVDPADDLGFPWEFRAGTELVERWNLPDAAGDPLYGLPALPARDLPESPYRHLSWFGAEHAEVFFGRGYEVRALYKQVTDPGGPPILLLYGPSGVGKSSLLDAGLMPRLGTAGYETRYRRRDARSGVMGSLSEAFRIEGNGATLGDAWRAEEKRLDRPLVVILDQVEEAYTRTGSPQPEELQRLVAVLSTAVNTRDPRPRGRLVLSFRKEWLADVDRLLAEANLPRNEVFLKALDRRGVAEAVRGPSREGRLKDKYHLTVEPGLPEEIADALLADAGSAVAPTLQVLLTKMWERARKVDRDRPQFDRALFESLKAEGYLLGDILDKGLKAIADRKFEVAESSLAVAWKSGVAESGLVLDLLAYHSTEFHTAGQVNRDVLEMRYAHRLDVLDDLIGQCKDRYLLIEAESRPDAPTRPTRLAHDLLAPLVLLRFRTSVAPGQRGRRLLENRSADWADGKTGPVFDRADLVTVRDGAAGMRAWTGDEVRLVEESRKEDERIKAEDEEQLRRIETYKEGQRQAEAEAKLETERRLIEQAEARQAAELHAQELEEANQRQKESNRKLRLGAGMLVGVLAVTFGVAGLAFWELFNVRKAENRRASAENRRAVAEVEELIGANPEAVPKILKDVRANPDALARLRERMKEPNLTESQKARAKMVLLDKDPSHADWLFQYILQETTNPEELLLIRGELVAHSSERTADLWKTVDDHKAASKVRLRAAAALAWFALKDSHWKTAGPKVVPEVLADNSLYLEAWTKAFRPVKEHFIEPLVQAFHGKEPAARADAANLLVEYSGDDTDRLLGLLRDADAQQYAILFPTAQAHPQSAVMVMNAEAARPPTTGADYDARDATAGRKANALITLARLGRTDPLWPALRGGPDPRVRTDLIQRLGSFRVDPQVLVRRLVGDDETDPSVRAAIVQALGSYPVTFLADDLRKTVAARLLAEYARDPDPGVHSSVFWLLNRWGLKNELATADRALAGKPPVPGRAWYVNPSGQTFVVVKDPGVFVMGSPVEEIALGRNNAEQLHHRRIPRSFAISTRETTVADFREFLSGLDPKDSPYLSADLKQFSPYPDGPMLSVTWFQAAQYCRWLSDREHVPEAEMCYPPLNDVKEDMKLNPNYLTRTGYRLPTEAEWEFACRAGTETPFSFGSDPSLLKDFAWSINNSSFKNMERAHPTCSWRPNGLGLFDMHGNVYEWCIDRKPEYPKADGPAVVDREQDDLKVRDADVRVYRGGSFADLFPMLRSAYRDVARPTNHFPAVGFRVARTYRPK